jgi:site-specific recombinase XerD
MHMPEPTDLDRMMATLDPRDPFGLRDRLMLGLARQTGLRVAELTGLDVDDVALDGCPRETLVVRAAIAKGGRSRIVPLNQTAREAVVGILRFNEARGFSVAPAAPLLVNRYHRRLSVRCVQLLVQALREKAGLDVPATPHTLRHDFASRILEATGNVRVTQALLGHLWCELHAIHCSTTLSAVPGCAFA